jgi:hypothetical protein
VKHRRLRKLVPDQELIRRRAAGESLRQLALDYDVEHTTLGRYFARPEVVRELNEAKRRLRAEKRAITDRRRVERRLEDEVRCRAREQTRRERADERRAEAVVAQQSGRRRRPRNAYEAWLDERDSAVPLTRRELWSRGDEIAAAVVAEGGGIRAVIEATGSQTLENVVNTIDPEIVKQAYDNDLLAET